MPREAWPTAAPPPTSRQRDARTVIGLVLSATAIGVGDVLIDDSSLLLGVLAVFPFAAAANAGPKATGVVGAYSVVLALLLGAPDDILGTFDHAARVAVVTVSTALGVRSSANREKRDRQLRESEARFEEFFRAAPVAMASVDLIDSRLRLLRGNRELLRLLGDRARKRHPFEGALSDPDRERLMSVVRSALVDLPLPPVTVAMSGDRGQVWVSVSAAAMSAHSGRGVILLHMQDVTASVEAQQQLRLHTLYDVLTGLPNRDVLLDRLGQSLARDSLAHAVTAVLFVDLDQFKAINDRFGHANGDRVLVTIAHRIQTLLRPTDTAARVGGDEFVVLCAALQSEDDAGAVARRIQEVITDPISLGSTSVSVAANIGIAVASTSGTSPEQVVRNADFAMNQAKQGGRARIASFDDQLHKEAAYRMDLEQALRQAVFRSQFVLHYQPVVDLVTGSLVGVEALVRWQDPDRGLLQPEMFIDIAEASDLIVPIGTWVVREACQQWAQWYDEHGRTIDVAVNVSPQQLGQLDFAAVVRDALTATGADPTHLMVEITERTFLDSSWAVTTELDKLSALGVQLVVDDFGTGYSSLLSLKRFTVSQIKVDRGFVAGLGRRDEDRVITAAILRLGQELGLTTVAEGVETPEQLLELRQLGCRLAQGHLFASPQPAADIPDLWGRRWYVG